MDAPERLRIIAETLIDPVVRYPDLTEAINGLYSLFETITGLDVEDQRNRQPMMLSGGKAIGPAWAGLCVKEILRTKKFVRGLYLAVQSVRKIPSAKPVRVLYAGAGPFATLVLPLTSLFSSDEIKLTLLEINPLSIACLEKVVRAFGIGGYIEGMSTTDALTYSMDRNRPYHIVLTETMQNALQKEPQVGITLNLAAQMQPQAILIPERIVIDAALMDPRKNVERMMGTNSGEGYYVSLGKIFEVSRETMSSAQRIGCGGHKTMEFPEVEIEIPQAIQSSYSTLCLFTRIHVFEKEILDYWECSLTLPKTIVDFRRNRERMTRIGFKYAIDQVPGFRWRVLALPEPDS